MLDSKLDEVKRIHRTSVPDEIVEQLLDLISRGVLKPGDRIPSEKRLCELFGVGRTSVREALSSLSYLGVLQSRNGEGTYVSEDNSAILRKTLQWSLLLEPKVLDDLMETRLTLECETAAFAALRASPEQMQEMEEGIKGMERSVANPSEYLEYDLKFHLAIAAAAQNSILYPLLTMIRGYLQTWIREALGSQNELDSRQRAQLSVAEHRTILAAVQKHDPDEARRAMAAHIHSSSMDLRRRAAGDSVTPDQVTALQGSTE